MAANPLLYRNIFTLLGYFVNSDSRFDESLSHTTFNGSSLSEIQGELAKRFPNYSYKLDLTTSFDAQKFKGFLEEIGSDPSNLQEFYDKLEQAVWTNDWSGLEPESNQEIAADQSGQLPPGETENPEQVSDIAQKGGSPALPNFGSPPSSFSGPRIVRQYPFRSGKEGGLGEGNAATNKINQYNAQNPATAKINQKRLNQMPATVKSWRAQQGLGFKPSLTRVAKSPVGSAAKSLGSQLGIGVRKLSTRAPGFVRGFLPQGIGEIFGGGRGNAGNFLNNFSRGKGGFGIPGFGSGGAGRGLLSRGGGFLKNRGGGVVRSARSRWLLWLLLLLSLGGVFFGLFNPAQETKKLPVRIDKRGPDAVANGQLINYTINVTNTASASADIQVTDTLPLGLEFVDANPKPTKTADPLAGGAIVWTLNGVGANQTRLIILSVKPKPEFKDAWVQNNVKATSLSTSGGGANIGGGGEPPNQDNCGGKYLLNNPLGNFGDPTCKFTKDDLFNLIKQNDPENAVAWFNGIIPCESSYDPNAYNFDSTSGYGGYGLYQMNPAGKGTGQYDRGDVSWQLQTSNAINHNKYIISLGGKWSYWACAYKFPDYKRIP